MICAFVMGGNGSVAIPPSVDPIISSSTTAGIVVRETVMKLENLIRW
jgi:hypothetical protein